MDRTEVRAKTTFVNVVLLFYLFLSTVFLFTLHMPVVFIFFLGIPNYVGCALLLILGVVFVALRRKTKAFRILGFFYFSLAAIYMLCTAYLISSLGLFVVLVTVMLAILTGILANRRFWIVSTISFLIIAAFAFKTSFLLGLGIIVIFAFFVPRRLLGYFSSASLAVLMASLGLHLLVLQIFCVRTKPARSGSLDELKINLSAFSDKARIRFAENIDDGEQWIFGLRGANKTLIEWNDKDGKIIAAFGGSGVSGDNAVVDAEAGLIYFGDYAAGCVYAASLDELKPVRSRCLAEFKPTFLELDGVREILYVASDASEQTIALNSDSFDLVEQFSCRGGIHHFCKFPDGRLAAVGGGGARFIFSSLV